MFSCLGLFVCFLACFLLVFLLVSVLALPCLFVCLFCALLTVFCWRFSVWQRPPLEHFSCKSLSFLSSFVARLHPLHTKAIFFFDKTKQINNDNRALFIIPVNML